jgi:hypothetical protein
MSTAAFCRSTFSTSRRTANIKPLQSPMRKLPPGSGAGRALVNGAVSVNVYDPPQIASSMPNGDGYLKIPVSIRYRTFVR